MVHYRRQRLIGRSPHAEVWEALHPDGTRVALKRTHGPAVSLRNEARNTARLHHPGIVQVLDLGELDGEAIIVQELASGGALPAAAAASWREARDLLAELLYALAHAHARGVVHLDIKPGNLLRFETAPRVRLADFGIARALGSATGTVAGTPSFMAPEQWRGDALRPATDLYALGCLGWLLLTGAPPFTGDADSLELAHAFSPLPPLRPVFAVPPATEAWLRGLLARDPLDRPRLAADALAGLRQVDPALPPAPALRRARPAGLQLGALREPVVQGRHAEKVALRAALANLSGPRRVVLSGPPGSGKTALCEWLATEAHASGAAVVARMSRGLAAMVAELLACEGADPELREDRLDDALATSAHLLPHDRGALGRLLDGDALPAGELDALLPRLLRHHARGRSLVWLVEDLPVRDGVLAALGDLPLLVLATSDAPVEGGLALEPLAPDDATLLLEDLAPLADVDVHRLVQRGGGNPQLLVLLSQDPVLPGSLRQAWRQRVLDLCPHPDALALAALLGPYVDGGDWTAACGRLGLSSPDVEPLLQAGILAAEPAGFRFVQALAREALLDHADLPRLRAVAASELLDQAARWLRTGNPTPAEAVLLDLDAVALPDAERGRACLLQAELARWRGSDALQHVERTLALARAPEDRVRALHGLASVRRQRGESALAAAARADALALATAHGLWDTVAQLAMETATADVRAGRSDAAAELLAEVRAGLPDSAGTARARLGLLASWLALKAGRFADAVALARAARPELLARGRRLEAYHALTYEGDAWRLLGDLAAAGRCFADAVALADAMGSERGSIARLNQGIVHLQRARPEAARPLLEAAAADLQAQDRATVELGARLWLLAALDGPAREACLARVEVLLQRVPGRDPDLLEAAAFAGARWDDPRLRRVVEVLR